MRNKQYNQNLTSETAAQGMKAALENAKSLLEDAVLLFENERYPRATALAILAIEEAGKVPILRMILLEDDPKTLKMRWQDYRRHTSKNTDWIVPELVKKGARHLNDLRKTVDTESNHRQILDNLKQLSFYSDVFSNCKWSSPKEVVDKELAALIISIAKVLANKERTSFSSEDELKLWIKHLKPVWEKESAEMKQALVNCYNEAEELGLIKKGEAQKMAEFVL